LRDEKLFAQGQNKEEQMSDSSLVHNFVPVQAKELSRTIGIYKPGKTVLLLGDSYAKRKMHFRGSGTPSVYKISLVVMKEMLHRMPNIGIVDGANRFDAYHLARLAQADGDDPSEILSRVFLSRVFTAFQMDGVITRGVDAFLSESFSGHAGRVMVVFGLLDLFYDDEISVSESEKSFVRISEAFERLKEKGISILLVSENLVPARENKRSFQLRLKAMADDIYQVDYGYLDGRGVAVKREKLDISGYLVEHVNEKKNYGNNVGLYSEGVIYISEGVALANQSNKSLP
jgi:hypothetical protein